MPVARPIHADAEMDHPPGHAQIVFVGLAPDGRQSGIFALPRTALHFFDQIDWQRLNDGLPLTVGRVLSTMVGKVTVFAAALPTVSPTDYAHDLDALRATLQELEIPHGHKLAVCLLARSPEEVESDERLRAVIDVLEELPYFVYVLTTPPVG